MKVNRDNYAEYIVDALDGTLGEADREALMRYLETDREAAEEYALLTKEPLPVAPVLPADSAAVNALKTRLRRSRLLRPAAWAGVAAAAVVLLGLFLVFQRPQEREKGLAGLLPEKDTVSCPKAEGDENGGTAVGEAGLNSALTARSQVPEKEETTLGTGIVRKKETGRSAGKAESRPSEPVKRDTLWVPVRKLDLDVERIRLRQEAPKPVVLAESGTVPGLEFEMEERPAAAVKREEGKKLMRTLLSPLGDLLPVRFRETDEKKEVVIASVIRIGKNKYKNQTPNL